MSLGCELVHERATVVAPGKQADLDQLVIGEEALQFADDGLCDPALAHRERGVERLSKAAEVGLLMSCERCVFHRDGPKIGPALGRGKPPSFETSDFRFANGVSAP